ncbi:hypothetical protein MTO96_018878 [Rhipicephalus appendiculatus]
MVPSGTKMPLSGFPPFRVLTPQLTEESQETNSQQDDVLSQESFNLDGEGGTEPQVVHFMAHSTRNPVRWPKDKVLQIRLEYIVHAVEKKEWPVPRQALVTPNVAATVAGIAAATVTSSVEMPPVVSVSAGRHSPIPPSPNDDLLIGTRRRRRRRRFEIEAERAKLRALLSHNLQQQQLKQLQQFLAPPPPPSTSSLPSTLATASAPMMTTPQPAHRDEPSKPPPTTTCPPGFIISAGRRATGQCAGHAGSASQSCTHAAACQGQHTGPTFRGATHGLEFRRLSACHIKFMCSSYYGAICAIGPAQWCCGSQSGGEEAGEGGVLVAAASTPWPSTYKHVSSSSCVRSISSQDRVLMRGTIQMPHQPPLLQLCPPPAPMALPMSGGKLHVDEKELERLLARKSRHEEPPKSHKSTAVPLSLSSMLSSSVLPHGADVPSSSRQVRDIPSLSSVATSLPGANKAVDSRGGSSALQQQQQQQQQAAEQASAAAAMHQDLKRWLDDHPELMASHPSLTAAAAAMAFSPMPSLSSHQLELLELPESRRRGRRPRLDPSKLDPHCLTGDENVSVINRLTGKKITGSKAPPLKHLAEWLEKNPMFDVDPKWSQLVKERRWLQQAKQNEDAKNQMSQSTSARRKRGHLPEMPKERMAVPESKRGRRTAASLLSSLHQSGLGGASSSSGGAANLGFPSTSALNPLSFSSSMLGNFPGLKFFMEPGKSSAAVTSPSTSSATPPLFLPFGGLAGMGLANPLFSFPGLGFQGLPFEEAKETKAQDGLLYNPLGLGGFSLPTNMSASFASLAQAGLLKATCCPPRSHLPSELACAAVCFLLHHPRLLLVGPHRSPPPTLDSDDESLMGNDMDDLDDLDDRDNSDELDDEPDHKRPREERSSKKPEAPPHDKVAS